ncbi:MAG: hypothetical protein IH874_04440 [Candidatus Dadabacteria bacterium]|nr:hypothetical protein [Candidatus Dadabacteria bacterium]
MVKKLRKAIERQSGDVYGVGAKKALPFYVLFTLGAVALPLLVIAVALLMKLL